MTDPILTLRQKYGAKLTSLNTIIGQDHIIPSINAKLKKPAPMIFSGKAGTGKTSTAKAYALELCEGNDLDIKIVSSAKHRVIDDMKDVSRLVPLASYSRHRVIIIDAVP